MTLRMVPVFAVLVLLSVACGGGSVIASGSDATTPGVTATADDRPADREVEPTPDRQPGLEDEVEATPVPGTRPAQDELDTYLLDERSLAVEISGPMSFADEPGFRFFDCELMDTVFAGHTSAGRRIRADLGPGKLRQSVVTMEGGTAVGVMDAIDTVWERCPLVTTDAGEGWWLEPVEMAPVDGWRSAGLAIGISPDLIWTIGFYQRDDILVFADFDAQSPWDTWLEVDAAIGALLIGEIDPIEVAEVSEPTPGIPRLEQASTPTPEPAPTPTLIPLPTPDRSWRDHPAARYAPDPSFFGEGWEVVSGSIQQAAPSDPEDRIEDCDVEPPPTMVGIEVEYEAEYDSDSFDTRVNREVEILIGIDDAEAAAELLAAFDLVVDCAPTEVTLVRAEARPYDADELVILDIIVDDDLLGVGEAQVAARYALGRFGPDVIGVVYSVVSFAEEAPTLPTADEMASWLSQWWAAGQ